MEEQAKVKPAFQPKDREGGILKTGIGLQSQQFKSPITHLFGHLAAVETSCKHNTDIYHHLWITQQKGEQEIKVVWGGFVGAFWLKTAAIYGYDIEFLHGNECFGQIFQGLKSA